MRKKAIVGDANLTGDGAAYIIADGLGGGDFARLVIFFAITILQILSIPRAKSSKRFLGNFMIKGIFIKVNMRVCIVKKMKLSLQPVN